MSEERDSDFRKGYWCNLSQGGLLCGGHMKQCTWAFENKYIDTSGF